jgi:hypothetical protein
MTDSPLKPPVDYLQAAASIFGFIFLLLLLAYYILFVLPHH